MAKVATVLTNAATALQDHNGHIRWPLPELMRYLNDGLLELQGVLLVMKPDEFTQTLSQPLAAGTLQTVADVHSIRRIWMNVNQADPSVRGRVVGEITASELDRINPYWHNGAQQAEVLHYILDPDDFPRFWCFPPSDGTGAVLMDVIKPPGQVTEALLGDEDLIASYELDLPVRDIFIPALTYYVLHRAWAKDADFAANQQTSNNYYNLFKEAIRTRPDAMAAAAVENAR